MKRVTSWLREAILGNTAYKVAALFFALVTWGWVQSEQVVEDDVTARVVWTFPDGLIPVETPPETVGLRVKGVQGYVRGVQPSALAVAVDLAGAREGQLAVDLAERPVEGLPPQVRVEAVTPTGVSLVLERLQERRVPVTPTTRGELGPGLRLARLTVSPDTATLRGPSSVLRAMAEVSTDAIDLSAITEDATVEVGLSIPRGQVTAASLEGAVPTRFLVKVDVSEETVSRLIEGVTLELPDGWRSAAPTVTLRMSGPARAVSAADPTALRVRAELPAASVGEAKSLTLRADATEGARLVVDLPEALAGARVEIDPLEISRP